MFKPLLICAALLVVSCNVHVMQPVVDRGDGFVWHSESGASEHVNDGKLFFTVITVDGCPRCEKTISAIEESERITARLDKSFVSTIIVLDENSENSQIVVVPTIAVSYYDKQTKQHKVLSTLEGEQSEEVLWLFLVLGESLFNALIVARSQAEMLDVLSGAINDSR